jgi:hypothetical protein
LEENPVSVDEKIYLAGVLVVFATFMLILGPLSWLDGRDERIKRRREKTAQRSKDQANSAAAVRSAIKHI